MPSTSGLIHRPVLVYSIFEANPQDVSSVQSGSTRQKWHLEIQLSRFLYAKDHPCVYIYSAATLIIVLLAVRYCTHLTASK